MLTHSLSSFARLLVLERGMLEISSIEIRTVSQYKNYAFARPLAHFICLFNPSFARTLSRLVCLLHLLALVVGSYALLICSLS